MKNILILFILTSAQVSAQSWYVKSEVEWHSTVEEVGTVNDFISFRSSNYENFSSLLPDFVGSMDWNNEFSGVTTSFFSFDSEILPSLPDESDIFTALPSSPIIESYIGKAGNKSILTYSFSPFFKDPSSGNIYRITEFVLKVDAVRDMTPSHISGPKKSVQSENSLLSEGDWFKIGVSTTGMHKISFNQLRDLGMSNPENIRIYGWGGHMIPENSEEGDQDLLLPTQVYFNKGTDGIFNSGDYLLFFARGPVQWSYSDTKGMFFHEKNNYSDYGTYLITDSQGSPVIPEALETVSTEPDYESNTYDILAYHEEDLYNFLKSGREWYGEDFDLSLQQVYTFSLPGVLTSEPAKLATGLLGRSKEDVSFVVHADNVFLDTVKLRRTNLGSYTSVYADIEEDVFDIQPAGEELQVKLKFNKSDPGSQGWLDYLAVNARAELNLTGDELLFRDRLMAEQGPVTRFTLSSAGSNAILWDVTDVHQIRQLNEGPVGGQLQFTVNSSLLREYIAFKPDGDFPQPVLSGGMFGKIENQDLKGGNVPDMVIVAYEGFLDIAGDFASYRGDRDGLDIKILTPMMIYNEFAGGRPDVTAIRNYMRYLYLAGQEEGKSKLKYLLFFGDASFDFKAGPEEGNYAPTYQSVNSLSPTDSYVTDDFFAMLDEGETMRTGLLDIGVGRFPVSTVSQAESMVEKIKKYEKPDRMGNWRNNISFISDDEDSNIHLSQADNLATYVEEYYPGFNINKIYMDAYPQVSTPTGERYPDVNLAINDQINNGALIINYTGHGGTKGLAQEQILTLNDIESWENAGKLPLFMTATCEFSRFDEPDLVSAGEQVILNPEGGGIALLTTTRLVWSGPNAVLNEKFYEVVFMKNEENENYCLGEIMQYSKNNAGPGTNKRNFTLLGDPSMKLAYPFHQVITDSINGQSVDMQIDTLKALKKVTISGHIADPEGVLLDQFNGIIFPRIYDKERSQTTLANDGGDKKSFSVRNNILYQGKATVENGRFHFSFIVPKDISYAFGDGKLSYYALDSITDASGAFEGFLVGGTYPEATQDNLGPEVEAFMNNDYFRTGGITNENPVLYVKIFDENGINTAGNGIGHDITAVIRGDDFEQLVVLNEFYQSELDSYQEGRVEYPLSSLEEGQYTVEVKVWDIYNNSATASTEFRVVDAEGLVLKNATNVPNPFTDFTGISFEHNKAGQDLEITLDIYSMNGQRIRSFKYTELGSGFRSAPLTWDGLSDSGTAQRQGVYTYRIRVKSSDGEESEISGKLLIIR